MMVIQMMKNQIESLEESIQTRETVIAQQKADIDRLHNLLAEECGKRRELEEKLVRINSDLDFYKGICAGHAAMIKELRANDPKYDSGFDKPGKDFKYI